jgi:hypothetical protein
MQSRATTRSARATLVGILLEMGSDFFKQTPLVSKAAKRKRGGFCVPAEVRSK